MSHALFRILLGSLFAIRAVCGIEFPQSLPFGSEQKVIDFYTADIRSVQGNLRWRRPDQTEFEYTFPPNGQVITPYDTNKTLLQQVRESVCAVAERVRDMDTNMIYTVNYGVSAWFPKRLGSTFIYGNITLGAFQLIPRPGGGFAVPAAATNVTELRLHLSQVFPYFEGLTSGEIAVFNTDGTTTTFRSRDQTFNFWMGTIFVSNRVVNCLGYHTGLMGSGLPGRIRVECYNGLVVYTYDHANGALLSREVGPPTIRLDLGQDRRHVKLTVKAVPESTVEIRESIDLESLRVRRTVVMPSTAETAEEIESAEMRFFRAVSISEAVVP